MKRTLVFILSLIFIFGTVTVSASNTLERMTADTAEYLYTTVMNPQVASIGGEWTIIGLSRSDADIPDEYYSDYCNTVENYVKSKDGVLHARKYTEYSRVVLALTSIDKDPTDVAGYNLLIPLGDFESTVWQGINGPVWALIALDSGNYEIPQNPNASVQATRELYINKILDTRLPDGGWALSGEISDPDITGMVLQALSKYQDRADVKSATDAALAALSTMQNPNGGFSTDGNETSESCIQVLVALCELGIPIDDPRFVKNENTLLDAIESYYTGGGFKHTPDGEANLMATEQCFYALVALSRMQTGKSSLYTMTDSEKIIAETDTPFLSGKHPDVKKADIITPGKTFDDINGHSNQDAIEALSSRGIINGKSDEAFEPDSTMTRAEFAAIIVRGLGLPTVSGDNFADVTASDWFFDLVNTAYAYGLVNGVSETEFNPNGTITREEAGVMVARAAKLCGMDTEREIFEARNILAEYFDYVKISDWAVTPLAFCYDSKILSNDVLEIKPKEAVTRAEIAQMLCNMLTSAELM